MGNLIKSKLVPPFAAMALFFGISITANAASIDLFDYGFNIDGIISVPTLGDPVPAAANISSFDNVTGLGTITVTITGAGAHSFDAIFDHEIDEPINTYFNESGSVSGTAAAGQSWEIDEPGYVFGNLIDNFELSTLDNSNNVPAGLEDDVSMAMGWDFTLAVGETALISLILGDVAPSGGFFLEHHDPNSVASIYLSSTLEISLIPVPAAIWLFGTALIGLVGFSRRRTATH